ncbi:hypothetical protein AVEN_231092-1 [Araneus ventricosus]|uniref:Uncharacterized protein n=1 Tax=Araneus ventricosus TaxID=182803 RepID=A0A4Y2MLK6_ARAVE|nr:hypothetical protein AVEN_231092-1 [Araneus ventricosus]
MSYKERHGHPSDILPTGSLLKVPSHIVHSEENRTTNFRNTYESYEPIYRSPGDIRGASRRKSRPKKIYKQNEGIEIDSNSFHVEFSAKCRTSRDERVIGMFSRMGSRISWEILKAMLNKHIRIHKIFLKHRVYFKVLPSNKDPRK